MIEDTKRLKTLFGDASVTPLPKRPGIRVGESHEGIETLTACMAKDNASHSEAHPEH